MNNLPKTRLAQAEYLLQLARAAQAEFWRSLLDFESFVGVEIESTIDLRDATLEHLLDPKAKRMILGLTEGYSGPVI
ncbi:MAG TPA: hypothetical protein VK716_04520 [Terracidiphilus sp.]|nr:hypothetical protein [Terracidiphilus sp.]